VRARGTPGDLLFELAARIQDELTHSKEELGGMDAAA
jgi:hypothetical protein